jgi:hypothetical protein
MAFSAGTHSKGHDAGTLEGVAMDHLATVVSAYYPIPSKFPPERYLEWIRSFWPAMRCPLVFFTEPALVPQMEQVLAGRGAPTQVRGLPFAELTAVRALSPAVWMDAEQRDPERGGGHSPALYALWYEKKEFVRRVIEENPFGTETFVWCDAGIGRHPSWIPHLQHFPLEVKVPRGRMLLLNIAPFEEADCALRPDGIRGEFSRVNRVGGGILASDRAGWAAWSAVYDAMFMRYYLAGRFVGKDQSIMASALVEDPDLVLLVQPPEFMQPVEKWFYLLFVLGGVRLP